MSENKLFPGRPDYTGPNMGLFGLLHHDTLAEWSDDVLERINYVIRYKNVYEQPIRLHNMIYLGELEIADKFDEFLKDYYYLITYRDISQIAIDTLKKKYGYKEMTKKINDYIKEKIPDTKWNGHELVLNGNYDSHRGDWRAHWWAFQQAPG